MNRGQVSTQRQGNISRSLGNGVNLGEQLDKFSGRNRTTMIFYAEDDVDRADVFPRRLASSWLAHG